MNVLVIAAHPDDDVLGCGGAVARHAAAGDTVETVIVAEGATSRAGAGEATPETLRAAAAKAAGILGSAPPRFLGLRDNRLDSVDLLDIVQALEAVIAEVEPTLVYTHHGGDLNIDHRIVFEAALTACRPVPGATVKRFYYFETLSSTEWAAPSIGPSFRPQRYVGIAETLPAKLAALECYQVEMRDFPHARSIEAIEALARSRGAQAGLAAAEAFEVIRELVP